MPSKDLEAIVCTVAYYFLRGVICEFKHPYFRTPYRGGPYEVERIAILSPMGDLIGYEINGQMMSIKKMKFVGIDEACSYKGGCE